MEILFETVVALPHTKFNFWRANYPKTNEAFTELNWCDMNELSVDSALTFFYAKINLAIISHVPRLSKRKIQPPWLSPSLRRTLNAKNRAHKRYKKSGLDTDYAICSILRRTAKNIQSESVSITLSRRSHPKTEAVAVRPPFVYY